MPAADDPLPDAELRAEIERYAETVTATWPAPGPAQAARLRALLNPHDLAERLQRLQSNAAGHQADLPEPSRRNRGHHRPAVDREIAKGSELKISADVDGHRPQ